MTYNKIKNISKIRYEKLQENRIDTPVNLIIYLFWIGQIYATHLKNSPDLGIHIIFNPIRDFYTTSIDKFPGFEVVSILFCLIIFIKFSKSYRIPNRKLRTFLYISILFIIFALINPNNYYDEGILNFLTFKMVRSTLFLIPFAFVLILLDKSTYKVLITRIFKIGIFVGISKASFDLLTFIIGLGPKNIFNRDVTTLGGDVLAWFTIFHIILIAMYLYTKNNKYLYAGLLFLLCLLFSYQRTGLFTAVLFDIVFYFIYTSIFKKKLNKTIIFIFSLIILSNVVVPIANQTALSKDILYRYGSVLQAFGLVILPENVSKRGYSDSGHLRQSYMVSNYFFDNIFNFWGGGLNRRSENYLEIKGQSSGGVHNNIVSMWQYFGIPGVLYILYIIWFFCRNVIINLQNRKNIPLYNYIELAIGIYFVIRSVAAWFSGDFIFLFFQTVTQLVLLISFSKLHVYKWQKTKRIYNKNIVKMKFV